MKDTTNIKGTLNVFLYRSDGSLKNQFTIPNLIVTGGKEYIASRLVGDPAAAAYWMGVGTGTSTPSVGDSGLTASGTRVSATVTRTGSQLDFTATFAPGNATATLTEAGIFTASTGGIMINRAVFTGVAKESTDTLVINWAVVIN